jgi:hypothetical protein
MLTNVVVATSTFNILTDFWILALPVRTLWTIHRPNREKVGLIFVFGLGIFSTIASIVRLHSIRIYTESKDPFYDAVPINLWSMIEVNIGIWCATIPALKALISKNQRERSRTGAYAYHSSDKSGAKISAASQKIGGSITNGSRGTAPPGESYDMNTMDGRVQQPKQTASRPSNAGSEDSGSQDRIVSPFADGKV